jgi:hypothetical protein
MLSQNQKFTRFPKLPQELRFKIWEFAIEPRIVEVCQSQDSEYFECIDYKVHFWGSKSSAPFYSPTALPTLLHVSRESRYIALKNYDLSFPNSGHPAIIYYNPSIDILYFPAWCFEYNIGHFELATSLEARGKIKRLAIDNLLWNCGPWNEGTINNQVRVGEFRGLEEFLLVQREPDELRCGCCYEFSGPELGVVSFGEQGEQFEQGVRECKGVFKRVGQGNKEWEIPSVKFVDLLRDGALI